MPLRRDPAPGGVQGCPGAWALSGGPSAPEKALVAEGSQGLPAAHWGCCRTGDLLQATDAKVRFVEERKNGL